MTDNDNIVKAIYSSIDQVNKQFTDDEQIAKTLDGILYGEGGVLDSLGLINFILAVEGNVRDELGTSISLANEEAMMQENSPFESVNSLAAYITTLV